MNSFGGFYFRFSFVNQVVEDGYEFFAKRQLVTLFSAPNYCGEFDNAGGMMSVDETLMCSFQVNRIDFSLTEFLFRKENDRLSRHIVSKILIHIYEE